MNRAMFETQPMDFRAGFAINDFVPIIDDVENFFGHGARICVSCTNWESETASARIWGESSVCSKAAASFSTGQCCFNSLNIIFRRWEKASLTSRVKAVA